MTTYNMGIDDLQTYQLAMTLGEKVWERVDAWDSFSKNTVGSQRVRAADSVAANIGEGYGRYHFKENIRFCYIARGSLFETKTWITKAYNRKLILAEEYELFRQSINQPGVKLNNYLNVIGKTSRTTKDTPEQ